MKKRTALLMIVALAVVCLFPVWGHLLPGADQAVTSENRALSRFPGAETPLTEWPGAVEDWFEDRLAFRKAAVSFITSNRLAETTAVLEGKDGWLYYLGSGSRDDLLRRAVLSASEKRKIRDAQQETVRRLSDAGAAYVVLICPDKQTVYPENLPDVFQGVGGETRLDQILPVLSEVPGLRVADTRAALREAKGGSPLYYLTDTHWNALGAWTAAKAAYPVLREALPALAVPAESSADVGEPAAHPQGDLAVMLNRQGMTDYAVSVTLREPALTSESVPNPENPLRETVIFTNPDHPELPRAVVFHDSFCEALRPYLAACFSRTVFVWSDHVRLDVVREEQPDLVIQQYVERLCPSGLAAPPAE